jgi:hypothetical protein
VQAMSVAVAAAAAAAVVAAVAVAGGAVVGQVSRWTTKGRGKVTWGYNKVAARGKKQVKCL